MFEYTFSVAKKYGQNFVLKSPVKLALDDIYDIWHDCETIEQGVIDTYHLEDHFPGLHLEMTEEFWAGEELVDGPYGDLAE